MEIKVFEMFLRVAEHGSINRAAQALNLSQPSLSRWLVLLEDNVGAKLLNRTPRGVELTDAGRLLVERAGPILRQLESLRDELGQKGKTDINLGMPSSMQRLVTVPFVHALRRQKPLLQLRVHEGLNNALRRWMEAGQLDLAIMTNLETSPPNFDRAPLLREPLMLVGAAGSGLRRDQPVPIAALDRLPFIMPGRPNVIRGLVENTLKRAGLGFHTSFEAETITLCLELALTGGGYSIVPSCMTVEPLQEAGGGPGGMAVAPIDGLFLNWDLFINRARLHAGTVQEVRKALHGFVAELAGSSAWPLAEMIPAARRPPHHL